MRVATGEGEHQQVYVPREAVAEVVRAVRRAKGVRKRRLLRERRKREQDRELSRQQRQELRWAIQVLNAAYGRPR